MSLRTATSLLPRHVLPLASRTAVPAAELPVWMQDAEDAKTREGRHQQLKEEFARQAMASAPAAEPATEAKEGVSYNVWMGANVQLFSSSKAEAKLLAMRSQNHWDLPIARAAARFADFLWPDCQTVVDEAMAKGKVMKNTRGIEADDVYMPPKVPEFLPITYWVANNVALRSSFVCDKTTAMRPRMSWYNPNDGMVPSKWLTEGFLADMAYYQPFSPPGGPIGSK